MALRPSCPATESPLSPASSGSPRKKCKCICYSPAPWAFFFQSLCSQARCSVWHTERISITNMLIDQWFQVLLAYKGDFPVKVCPSSSYTLIAPKTNDHSLCNKQLKTLHFCISFSLFLYSFYSHYIPSKLEHTLHLLHLAIPWLIKRQITSISLWRIEYFCIVKAVVSNSEGTHCPFLSLSPLE